MRFKMKSEFGIKKALWLFLILIVICIIGFSLNLAIIGIMYNFVYSYELLEVLKLVSSSVMGLIVVIFCFVFTAKMIINSISIVKVDEVEIIIPVEKKESKKIKEEVKETKEPVESEE